MTITAFLHQKGGTGKSTLSVATAMALAAAGERVLLVDADPQGTSSEWAMRYGERFGVQAAQHIQPDFAERIGPLGEGWPHLLIDGPPALSPVTESILGICERLIIPLRPALPDVWALTWLAAMVTKRRREGQNLAVAPVFNMFREEPLEPLLAELARWNLEPWPEPVPAHPAFAALFAGEALPPELGRQLLMIEAGQTPA